MVKEARPQGKSPTFYNPVEIPEFQSPEDCRKFMNLLLEQIDAITMDLKNPRWQGDSRRKAEIARSYKWREYRKAKEALRQWGKENSSGAWLDRPLMRSVCELAVSLAEDLEDLTPDEQVTVTKAQRWLALDKEWKPPVDVTLVEEP